MLHGVQSRAQIVDEILRVLETDGQAHEAVRDTYTLTLLRLDVSVGHRYRMSDERLD